MRLLFKEFESSIQSFPAVNLKQLKLDPNQEEVRRVMNSREFREFGDQFHVYVQVMREKGSFWYLELCCRDCKTGGGYIGLSANCAGTQR